MFASTVKSGLITLALLFTLPAVAGVGVGSVQIELSPDFSLDSAFPAGDKPPTPSECTWDIADALDLAGINNLVEGVAFSHDVRQYLTTTDPADPPLSIIDISATAPFSDPGSGDNLVYDETTTGTGTFRIQAECDAGIVQSAVKSWTAAPADTVPDAPTGLQATVVSDDRIDLQWVASAGATSYKARLDGSVVASGITDTDHSYTGLDPSTTYALSVIATNATGDSVASSAVNATTEEAATSTFDPPYPRLFLRQAFSNMNVLDPDNSLSDFNSALAWVAKYHASMGNSGRSKTLAGGTVTSDELPGLIKGHANYNSSVGSMHTKYTNVTQIGTTGDEFSEGKSDVETTGGLSDWNVNVVGGGQVIDVGHAKEKMNYTTFVDEDHNGFQWTDWYANYEYAASGDAKAGFSCSNYPTVCDWGTGNDWVASSGKGLKEGEWDGVFEDDTAMWTGDAGTYLDGKDLDGLGGADLVTDADVKTAMSEGFVRLRGAWDDLFAVHPPGTLKYFIGNITAIVAHNDYWPLNMRSIFNGGLVEEFSGKTMTRKFGNYTTHDNATPLADGSPTQPWSGVLGMYRRAMDFSISPKMVAMGHEPEPEWREKWKTAGQKNNNWICEGGTCSTAAGSPNSCSGTGCKYPGNASHLSDYRLMRWALAFVMMDDGFFSTNQTTSTWNTGLPWYDEYVGGEEVNQVGWCGNEVDPPQRAAREQGVWYRVFQNCLVGHNPMRATPNVVQTKTITIPSAGTGFRWKKLKATVGGFTTDGNSGTQDATMNDNTFVTTCGNSGTYTVKEIDGFFFRKVAC